MKSEMRLIKTVREFIPVEEVNTVGRGVRGIYVLYNKRRKKDHRGRNYMDVVYVGMARSGIAGRLRQHRRHKEGDWTHFTLFEVHDNTTDLEIEELEGLFRFVYRLDSKAGSLNKQRSYRPLNRLRRAEKMKARNEDT